MLEHRYKVQRKKLRLVQWKYRYYHLKSKSRPKIGVRKGKDSSVGKQVVGEVCNDGTDDDAMELDYDDDCFDIDREDYDLLECEDEDDICVEMEEDNGFVTFDDTIVLEAIGTTTYSQVYRGKFSSYDISSSIFQKIVILQHEM